MSAEMVLGLELLVLFLAVVIPLALNARVRWAREKAAAREQMKRRLEEVTRPADSSGGGK